MATSKVIWTLKEITTAMRQRQLNEFDCNFGVSGKRGDGKSTLLFKIFNSFKNNGFKQEKHQEYSQKKIMDLLQQYMSFVWDDEAINSGYKRDFQKTGQKNLIKMVTTYRDNFNIYGSAVPFFYSLDKDLRELMFMHIHIIERGVAVIFMPLRDQIHSQDPWDTARNKKIEESENKRLEKDPKLRFRYHRFTTFAGYLYFGPMTPKQKKKYNDIKKAKRHDASKELGLIESREDKKNLADIVYEMLVDGKLSRDGLVQICYANGRKFSTMQSQLNNMLTDKGISDKTVKDFLIKTQTKAIHNKDKSLINDLVPSF